MSTSRDLVELGRQLVQDRDEFLRSADLYDTSGPLVAAEVAKRLDRLVNPTANQEPDTVAAAWGLHKAIKNFSAVHGSLVGTAAMVSIAIESISLDLKVGYWATPRDAASIKVVPIEQLSASINAYFDSLQTAHDKNVAYAANVIEVVTTVASAAFKTAQGIVEGRLWLLLMFIKATNPPGAVTDKHGNSYLIRAAGDAVATEVTFSAGEVIFRRLGIEMVGHVPILNIGASIAKVLLDVRKEMRSFHERQALHQAIADGIYQRNVGDEARRFARLIKEDDVKIDEIVKLVAKALDELVHLTRELSKLRAQGLDSFDGAGVTGDT